MRALHQHGRRLVRPQPDKLLAVGAQRIGPRQRPAAYEIAARLDHPAQAEIVRRHRSVGLLTDDDESLLGAQKVHGFRAVGRDAGRCAPRHDLFPQPQAVGRRDIDLVGELAGEGDAEHAHGNAPNMGFAPGHELEAGRIGIQVVAELRHQTVAVRPADRRDRPLLGDGGEKNPQLRPFGLQVVLKLAEHAGCAAGGRRHVEMVVGQTDGDAVVHHHAVLAKHQPVAGFSRRQLQPGVGIYAVEELPCVRAADVDLAERRGIQHADGRARRLLLALHGVMETLAGDGIGAGAQPVADRLEGHRLVRLTKGRRADRRDLLAAF